METILKCVILTFAVCFIVDYSGVMQKANRALFSTIYGTDAKYNGWYIPLFGCSLCLTWWVILGYSLFIAKIGIVYSLGLASIFSFSSSIFTDTMKLIKRWFSNVLNR